ncbi:MAG: DUF1559 domain-containing protein [Planctomycetia bacterium]|nr:DUF1559 domain-containing protein [Planctomycetia bacterium]
MSRKTRKLPDEFRNGFTLIEILVVAGILSLLLALLLPAAMHVREAARRFQCSSNMRQIGLGILCYEGNYKRLPPSHTKSPDHNILTFILPFIEQEQVYKNFDLKLDWNKGKNAEARKAEIPIFRCPSAQIGPRSHISDYAANVKIQPAVYNPLIKRGIATKRKLWYNMLRPDQRPVRVAEVRDGMSYSMLFFEDGGRPYGYENRTHTGSTSITGASWADVDAFYYTHSPCNEIQLMNCTNMNETFSFHSGGCFFLYGDSSVTFHSEEINPETFFSRFTYNQRDRVNDEF